MKVAIAGASGLIGSALIPYLMQGKHSVYSLTRDKKLETGNVIYWNPEKEELEKEKLEGIEVFINLSGENIANRRWTAEFKRKIVESRVQSTRFLSSIITKLSTPPKALINASAMGFYGNRGDEILDEQSSSGKGFFAETCIQWEAATQEASNSNIRVINARFGIVLSKNGGAIEKMLPPFKLGLGSILGNGEQYLSWITIDDAVRAILHCINTETLSGPVNITNPNPVTNREFTKTLGKILKRPTFLTAPAWLLRATLGEMADQTLLSSIRIKPEKLLSGGFLFNYSELHLALSAILKS